MANLHCTTHQRLSTQLSWLLAEQVRLTETGRAHKSARLRIDCRIAQVTDAFHRHRAEHGC